MICIKCGAEIPEGAKFCPNCGSQVPDKEAVAAMAEQALDEQLENIQEQNVPEQPAAPQPDHPVPHLELASDEPAAAQSAPQQPGQTQPGAAAQDPFAAIGKPPVYPGAGQQGTYSQTGPQTGSAQQGTYHQTNPQQGNASQVFSSASSQGSAYNSGDRNGSFAIVALILSILGGLLCCIPVISPLLSLGGLVLGILGLKSDRKSMAVVAIVISAIFLLLGGLTSIFGTAFASRINTSDFDINQFINDLEKYAH